MIYYRFTEETASAKELHEIAHRFLAELLKKNYGIENYRIEKGEQGKPFLPDYPEVHFNLSHCRGLVVCGFSDSEIGVDAELVRPYNGRAGKRVFSPSEAEQTEQSDCPEETFFRFWTLKESLGKNLGTGLSSSLSEVSFRLDGENPKCEKYPEKFFLQKIIEKKWVVSICADNPIFFINRNAFCS